MGDYQDSRPAKPVIKPLDPRTKEMEELRVRMNVDKTQFDIIVKKMCEDADIDDLEQFLYSAKNLNLDPVMGQIYMQIRWSFDRDAARWKKSASIQTGIEGLRSMAEREKDYAGQDPMIFHWDDGAGNVKFGKVFPEGANVLAVEACVYRYVTRPDKQVEKVGFPNTAYLKDFAQRYAGKLTHMWEKIGIMLTKCAEAGAFRKGWPQVFKNLYIAEEMMQADERSDKEVASAVTTQSAGTSEQPKAAKAAEGKSLEAKPQAEASGTEEKKALTMQEKAGEIIAGMRDRYKEKAGDILKEYITKSSGSTKYADVPQASKTAVIDLLHIKLKESGAKSVIDLIEESLSRKKESNGAKPEEF